MVKISFRGVSTVADDEKVLTVTPNKDGTRSKNKAANRRLRHSTRLLLSVAAAVVIPIVTQLWWLFQLSNSSSFSSFSPFDWLYDSLVSRPRSENKKQFKEDGRLELFIDRLNRLLPANSTTLLTLQQIA
jgi:hypothetical protein